MVCILLCTLDGINLCFKHMVCMCFLVTMGAFSFPMKHPRPAQVSLLISWAGNPRFIYVEVSILAPYLEWPKVQVGIKTQISCLRVYICTNNQTVVLGAAASSAHQIIALASNSSSFLTAFLLTLYLKNIFVTAYLSFLRICIEGVFFFFFNFPTFSVTYCYKTGQAKT